MCGGEGNDSGFRWSLQEEENWFQLPELKKRRSLCICNRLSDTHQDHGKLTATLKALRQSSLLGCTTCRGLLAGIRSILDAPPRKERRDSMDVELSREDTIQDHERCIDELVLSYQVDPNFECPLSPGGWNLRCACEHSCPHQKYHMDFEIISPHTTQTVIGEFPTRQASLIHNESTGSDATLDFISKSLAHCDAVHSQTCARFSSDLSAPTRLLEISDDRVRLVEVDPSVDVKYACLAHRWATRQPWDDEADTASPYSKSMCCRTLRSNLSERKAHVNLEELLPTYQDAARVTKRLGISYLWLDSLCIVQDDADDVRKQIARMGSIYGNSYVTIAADTLKDHTQSFLSSRKWRWRAQEHIVVDSQGFSHKLFFRERPKHSQLGWGGLFDRAWCFQERLLSPRVVRFQADEVIFECNEGLVCECGNPPAGHQGPWEDLTHSAHLHDKAAFHALLSPTSRASITESWHHLVHAYSKTHLTRESDRMNAFAGIVSRYHERSLSHSMYLAGLWSHSLWTDLLWSVTRKHPPLSGQMSAKSSTIPSWSWMSITLGSRSIAYPKFKLQQAFPRLNRIHYEPLSTNLPLGDNAPGAYLEIQAQLTQIPASYLHEVCEDPMKSTSIAASVIWDSKVPDSCIRNALFLLRMAYLRQEPVVKEAFLILELRQHTTEQDEKEISSFTRVGYLEVSKDGPHTFSGNGVQVSEDYQTLRLY